METGRDRDCIWGAQSTFSDPKLPDVKLDGTSNKNRISLLFTVTVNQFRYLSPFTTDRLGILVGQLKICDQFDDLSYVDQSVSPTRGSWPRASTTCSHSFTYFVSLSYNALAQQNNVNRFDQRKTWLFGNSCGAIRTLLREWLAIRRWLEQREVNSAHMCFGAAWKVGWGGRYAGLQGGGGPT